MIYFAKNDQKAIGMYLDKLNRHGLIAGATGTGKTITLKVIVEQLSQQGIPVFLADIKGDLASLSQQGQLEGKVAERVTELAISDFKPQSYPVRLWDILGQQGTPIRATISEMGPLLLGRLLELNNTQMDILNIIFKIADDEGMLLIDMKDLRALIQEVAQNSSNYSLKYGNIAKQSIAAIQRSLTTLEQQGGEDFFGEPALDLMDFIQTTPDGYGYINILMAQQLFQSPKLYSTFLLWLLSELFEVLPEVGDLSKPKMVFFFDEAHLLFNDAPKVFVDKVVQVVRLIRSKGVGIYFITQNPSDLPEDVLSQLGNRIQHALRAYTPKEIKAVKMAATSFRPNPQLDTAQVITELKVGEALISCLNNEGQPEIVERAFIYPPQSLMGTVTEQQFDQLKQSSSLDDKYRHVVDRESAYEILQQKLLQQQHQEDMLAQQRELEKQRIELEKERERQYKANTSRTTRTRKTMTEKATDSFISTVTRTLGREIIRSIFGTARKR